MNIFSKIFGGRSKTPNKMEKIAQQIGSEYSNTSAAHPDWSPKQVVESMGRTLGSMPACSIGLCECVCVLTERATGLDPRAAHTEALLQSMSCGSFDDDMDEPDCPMEIIERILLDKGVSEEVLHRN